MFGRDVNMYVVVQFYPWFKFYFPLFWVMVMYDNEFEPKKIKLKPRIELNHNIYLVVSFLYQVIFAFLLSQLH